MVMSQDREFVNIFYQQLDDYIRDNLSNLTCGQIRDLYNDCAWVVPEKYRGCHSNLTGFFELIIFRFFCHYLGCSNRNGREFSRKNSDLSIAQGKSISLNTSRKYPDISIWQTDTLCAVVELKLTPPGNKSIKDDLNKLETFHEVKKTKGMFISYGYWYEANDFGNKNTSWFTYVCLDVDSIGVPSTESGRHASQKDGGSLERILDKCDWLRNLREPSPGTPHDKTM